MAGSNENKVTTDLNGERLVYPPVLQPARPNPVAPRSRVAPSVQTPPTPAPRETYTPAQSSGEEPGFYIVPKSVTAKQLYDDLFDDMPPAAMVKFSALNPNLGGMVKAASIVVLSDPRNTSCTYFETQLMQAAETVNKALEPLSPAEADFMYRHAAEIATYTGQTSTWLGVSAAVMETHLTKMRDTLQDMERLHQESFRQHGNLKSPEFFAERQRLLAQLDAHLLNSTRLRGQTTLGDHPKLKTALGISSRSLVHHWSKAGAPGQIPGYATHVTATSRAAKYMTAGGYIGIGIGAASSLLAVQDVCNGDSRAACEKIKFTEGSKFSLATGLGFAGGEIAKRAAAGPLCLALGASTSGIGGVVCVAAIVGVGALAGVKLGEMGGEKLGEKIYEATQP